MLPLFPLFFKGNLTLRIPPVPSITGPDSGSFNSIIYNARNSSSPSPISFQRFENNGTSINVLIIILLPFSMVYIKYYTLFYRVSTYFLYFMYIFIIDAILCITILIILYDVYRGLGGWFDCLTFTNKKGAETSYLCSRVFHFTSIFYTIVLIIPCRIFY